MAGKPEVQVEEARRRERLQSGQRDLDKMAPVQVIQTKDTLQQFVDMYKLYTDDTVTIEDFKDKPKAKKQKVSSQPSDALDSIVDSVVPQKDWAKRDNSGKVEATFNPQLELNPEIDDEVELKVELLPHHRFTSQRYMNDKLSSRAEYMEQKLEKLSEVMIKEYNLEQPSAFHVPIQDPIVAVGTISSEIDGKLNEAATVLQSSKAFGSGRVRLGLRDVEDFSLFPGQVVAVQGINPNGKLFLVNKLYQGVPLEFNKQEMDTDYPPFSVVVASGPWTTTENLNFDPLKDMLAEIQKNPPELLILIGPFVDSQNPKIVNSADLTYEEIFTDGVMKIIEKSLKDVEQTQVIIIPSIRDLNHDLVFPQPALPSVDVHTEKPILFYPNPSTFVVNGVTIGLTSVDVLRSLASEEVSRSKPGGKDRVSKLCDHLITQRSYCPQFPGNGIPIDTTRMSKAEFSVTPDILILPSDLQLFVKNVNDVLVINPGRISRGNSAGTYARFTVYPSSTAPRVVARTRVDLIHL